MFRVEAPQLFVAGEGPDEDVPARRSAVHPFGVRREGQTALIAGPGRDVEKETEHRLAGRRVPDRGRAAAQGGQQLAIRRQFGSVDARTVLEWQTPEAGKRALRKLRRPLVRSICFQGSVSRLDGGYLAPLLFLDRFGPLRKDSHSHPKYPSDKGQTQHPAHFLSSLH